MDGLVRSGKPGGEVGTRGIAICKANLATFNPVRIFSFASTISTKVSIGLVKIFIVAFTLFN
jgi:hypothetical protein